MNLAKIANDTHFAYVLLRLQTSIFTIKSLKDKLKHCNNAIKAVDLLPECCLSLPILLRPDAQNLRVGLSNQPSVIGH